MKAKYRRQLPQLDADIFLTDGGIETTLIFHDGLDLPLFAAFDLLKDEAGRTALRKYFSTYAAIAKENRVGMVLETVTWRASKDWGKQLGYTPEEIKQFNLQSVDLLQAIRSEFETEHAKIVISGCIGPRGDGYIAGEMMSADDAELYHTEQVKTFHESDADMVAALTMTYPEEAIGLVRAAKAHNMPLLSHLRWKLMASCRMVKRYRQHFQQLRKQPTATLSIT